jgi:hypothetical protein
MFLLHINGFHLCSALFDFYLFADDANLFYSHKDIDTMQQNINSELSNVHSLHGFIPTNSPLILKYLISLFSIHHKKSFPLLLF